MDYQIIATLGPASAAPALWQAMLAAGATAFRLNTSHLSLAQLDDWLAQLGAFGAGLAAGPPLALDLQGSKWRLGRLADCTLTPGQPVELRCVAATDEPGVLPAPHPDFFQAAGLSNGEVVLNDARVSLALESVASDSIRARVVKGGPLSSHKGITLPSSTYRKEALSEKDQAIVERTRGLAGIRYALSYVKDAVEMARYRAILGRGAYLIAKLERPPALEEAAHVAAWADEVWLCRGDLGAELGLKAMAEAVQRFAGQLGTLNVPVLLAGQVLEHMTAQPNPTRSEVCYLYDALLRGYRGLVLSDETAVGRYPVESCRMAALFQESEIGRLSMSEEKRTGFSTNGSGEINFSAGGDVTFSAGGDVSGRDTLKVGGDISVVGGDQVSGDKIEVGDVAAGAAVAVGRGAAASGAAASITSGLTGDELVGLLAQWRADMGARIDAQPDLPAEDKDDLNEIAAKIEREAAKGQQANPKRLEKLIYTLAVMGPDIFDVAVTTLTDPLKGIGLALKKIGDRVQLERVEAGG